MLSAVPSALEECTHSVPDPQHLKTVLMYHTTLGNFDLSGEFYLSYQVVFAFPQLFSSCLLFLIRFGCLLYEIMC